MDRFVEYGVNVWNIDANLDKFEIANKAIDATEAFFGSIGIPMTLSALGIGDEKFEEMSAHVIKLGGLEFAFKPLQQADVLAILNKSL